MRDNSCIEKRTGNFCLRYREVADFSKLSECNLTSRPNYRETNGRDPVEELECLTFFEVQRTRRDYSVASLFSL